MVKISQIKKQAENLNRHIHTQKNEILSYVTWVDLMGIRLSEISQRDKDKYEFIYVELKKKMLKDTESGLVIVGGEGFEG